MDFEYIVLTVATDENHDGFKLFTHSCKKFKINYKVLGLDTMWEGGDITNSPGGGHKVNLLKKELSSWNADKLFNTIVLFTDSYDVVFLSEFSEILDKYLSLSNYKNTVLFSAETTCWPDKNLKRYFNLNENVFRYLNSGGYIGFASNIFKILQFDIENNFDDQLFFTKVYLFLNSEICDIKLDNECLIFQCLSHMNEYKIVENKFYNTITNSNPYVLHGNGSENEKKKWKKIALEILNISE